MLQRVLILLAGLVIVRVTFLVVLKYDGYFPPDFESDFLQGRQGYFWGTYRWAFYPHILSGPVALLLGLLLVSNPFRRRFPAWHRMLGKIQVANVLLLVAPSGLWMAYWAEAGPIAGTSFAFLAIATGATAALGWRAAVRRRFDTHRRWMERCYLLLCAAVVLRLMGGTATLLEVQSPWYDPLAAWACWVLPLGAWELRAAAARYRWFVPPKASNGWTS